MKANASKAGAIVRVVVHVQEEIDLYLRGSQVAVRFANCDKGENKEVLVRSPSGRRKAGVSSGLICTDARGLVVRGREAAAALLHDAGAALAGRRSRVGDLGAVLALADGGAAAARRNVGVCVDALRIGSDEACTWIGQVVRPVGQKLVSHCSALRFQGL